MKAKAIQGFTVEEIKSKLRRSMDDGFTPTLAIVFTSVSQDRSAISKLFSGHNIQLFGETTNGEFIDEDHQQGSIAALLMDIDSESFQIFLEEYPDQNYREVSTSIATKAKMHFKDPAFLIGMSHTAADGEKILQGLKDVMGEDINAFGGAAGDDFQFKENFVFTNEKESNQGMVLLAMDQQKIKVKGVATCGWKAVGTEKIVTKSEGNHVYTIDGVPAVTITAKYGGLEVSPENQETLIELATNFPLQLQQEDGDPLMRPGLVVDWDDLSYYTSGSVPQGSKVRFSLPPDWDVVDKVIKGVENLKVTEMPDADAVVVFSCAGRTFAFGPMMNAEIEGVKNVWNTPMVGMFSNAELGRYSGSSLELHNLTTCTIVLKEL